MKEVSFWNMKPIKNKPMRLKPLFNLFPNKAKPLNGLLGPLEGYPVRSKSEWNMIVKHPMKDSDGDGIMDWYDCKPKNKKKKGWAHKTEETNKTQFKSKVVFMTPDKFLKTTYREKKNIPNRLSRSDEELKKSKSLDPRDYSSYLDILMKNNETIKEKIDTIKSKEWKEKIPFLIKNESNFPVSHDGRHRAIASKKLGIKKIPVLVSKRRWDNESKPLEYNTLSTKEFDAPLITQMNYGNEDTSSINRLFKENYSNKSYVKKAYRGRRIGSPEGGFYVTSKLIAKTYGPVEEKEVTLKNPKRISKEEWGNTFGLWDVYDEKKKEEVVKSVLGDEYDGAISNFGIRNDVEVIYKKRESDDKNKNEMPKNMNNGPDQRTLAEVERLLAEKKSADDRKVAERLSSVVTRGGMAGLGILMREEEKQRRAYVKRVEKNKKDMLKRKESENIMQFNILQRADQAIEADAKRRALDKMDPGYSYTTTSSFGPSGQKKEVYIPLDARRIIVNPKEKEPDRFKMVKKKGKWVRVNITEKAKTLSEVRTQTGGRWLSAPVSLYKTAVQIKSRYDKPSAQDLIDTSRESLTDRYPVTKEVIKTVQALPSVAADIATYTPGKKATAIGRGVQRGVAGVSKALFASPLQTSRGKGRPSGPSGKYFIEGNPVYEEQYQQYKSKQRSLNRMSPSQAQAAPLTTEQLQSVDQLRDMPQEQMPADQLPQDTMPEQMPEQVPQQMQERVEQIPNEYIRQQQMQEQVDDNILKAPSFMKGELKATGGNILTPTGPQILDAPQMMKGQMRTLNRQNPQEFSEVKLGARPQTNAMGSEYLDIELGSGRPIIKRRITEKWMSGEAL